MSPAKTCLLTCFVAAILLPGGVSAQDLWPGMEKYVTVKPDEAAPPRAYLVNLYSAPLVAAYWDYKCPGRADFHRQGGSSDAALAFAAPAVTGDTFNIVAPREGCEGQITAIVWADGKEIGDPPVLKQFHDCREAAWDEMHTFLSAHVYNMSPDQWDARVSAEMLKARLAPEETTTLHGLNLHDTATHVCRANALQFLAQSIESYRSFVANNPDQLIHRRGLFLEFLKEWEAALHSPNYPANRLTWDLP